MFVIRRNQLLTKMFIKGFGALSILLQFFVCHSVVAQSFHPLERFLGARQVNDVISCAGDDQPACEAKVVELYQSGSSWCIKEVDVNLVETQTCMDEFDNGNDKAHFFTYVRGGEVLSGWTRVNNPASGPTESTQVLISELGEFEFSYALLYRNSWFGDSIAVKNFRVYRIQ